MGDDHVFCWDCNRNYSYSECFSSRTPVSLADARKEQLTLFEPDAESINGLNSDSEKEPNGWDFRPWRNKTSKGHAHPMPQVQAHPNGQARG